MGNGKCLTVFVILFMLISTASSIQSDENEDTSTDKVPVLLYHHLLYDAENNDKENATVISVESFTEQIKYLKDNGYTTITMEQLYAFLYNKETLPLKSVLITFDDGYYSNYLYAYPILKEYGFKASSFIVTGFISTEDRVFNPNAFTMLDQKSMEASKDVFTYYSHTDNFHGEVKGISGFTFYDKDLVVADMLKSFEMTDRLAFAYPYGAHTETTIEILKDLHIKLAFTTQRGYVTASTNPYLLPRWVIHPRYTAKQFERIVSGAKW